MAARANANVAPTSVVEDPPEFNAEPATPAASVLAPAEDVVAAGLLERLLHSLRGDVVADGRVSNTTRQALDRYDTHQRGVAASAIATRQA